jgi:hypothetical protein
MVPLGAYPVSLPGEARRHGRTSSRQKSAPILGADLRPDDFAYKRLGMDEHNRLAASFFAESVHAAVMVAADDSRWVSVKRDAE